MGTLPGSVFYRFLEDLRSNIMGTLRFSVGRSDASSGFILLTHGGNDTARDAAGFWINGDTYFPNAICVYCFIPCIWMTL